MYCNYMLDAYTVVMSNFTHRRTLCDTVRATRTVSYFCMNTELEQQKQIVRYILRHPVNTSERYYWDQFCL